MRWNLRNKVRIAEVSRLRIEPGDQLLITVPANTTMNDAQLLREAIEAEFEATATIITDGIEFSVVHRDDPDTITITISREDADYMAEDEWVDKRLARIADACRATLDGSC
jgi:hypothetical protein